MPFLTIFAMFLGILGGYLYTTYNLTISPILYIANIKSYLTLSDILSGLIKSCFFGFTLSFIGCYEGFFTTGGARGVGLATTKSVGTWVHHYFNRELFFKFSAVQGGSMISIEKLTKKFDDHLVLKGVNLSIPSGKMTCIIGRSGEGKSVLLKTIIGLIKPTSGSIIINGKDITTFKEKERISAVYRMWLRISICCITRFTHCF